MSIYSKKTTSGDFAGLNLQLQPMCVIKKVCETLELTNTWMHINCTEAVNNVAGITVFLMPIFDICQGSNE